MKVFVGLVLWGMLWGAAGCRTRSTPPSRPAPASPTARAQPRAVLVVGGMREPVALAFLTADQWLVAERRTGAIRWVEGDRLRPTPFARVAVPQRSGYHEFGLLGLAVDPGYPERPYVYAFHTVPDARGRPLRQRIVRFTVRNQHGVTPPPIVDNLPVGRQCCHNGGRISFGLDGLLYVTLGDCQRPELAQTATAVAGKILRYTREGGIPADNPRGGGSRPTPVFTRGHRNPFGLAFAADGRAYVTENGPDHDDEINRLVAGANYGWPTVMGPSTTPAYRPPVWASGATVIAPTGATIYTGTDFPTWRNQLVFAAYIDGRLRRMPLSDSTHPAVSIIPAADDHARLEVAMGRDGRLYFTSVDAVYRLEPTPQ